MRLEQVLINLVNNAIKYSPNATQVKVSIYKHEHSIEIAVKDYGVGISPEESKNCLRYSIEYLHFLLPQALVSGCT